MGGFRSRAKGSLPERLQASQASALQKKSSPRARGSQRSTGSPRNVKTDEHKAQEIQSVDPARRVAFDTIVAVMARDAFSNLLLPRALREAELSGRDAAFATEVVYGTLRNQGLVDAVITECSSRPLEALDTEVLAALRMGAYQLLLTRVEDHAAVDTTVQLAKAVTVRVAGFVNAVMRAISRHPLEYWIDRLSPDPEAQPVAAVAFRTSHPQWIAESFANALAGHETAHRSPSKEELAELEACLKADSGRPCVHLVARPGLISRDELVADTGGSAGLYSPYAVYLEKGDPGLSRAVQTGRAAVQDEGSQMIAEAFVQAPVEGRDSGRWLDLCAGPGGKTALIACLGAARGAHVDAVEIAAHRAELVRTTTTGLPVEVHVADGRLPGLTPGFDRVLVDAPCSGLGALRRRPEARWRKQESDITQLNTLQYELLGSAAELVRPGGIIIYSTCSPDLRETRQIVDAAVADFPLEECDAQNLFPLESVGGWKSVQMWPFRHGTDAMFCAVLRKNS